MPPRPSALGVVVDDMAAALAFYRRLGIDVSSDADSQPHVEAHLGGGLRLLFDTAETIRSFDPEWQPPPHGQHRTDLAFELDSPADVDELYASLTGDGYHGHKPLWDAFWGQRYAIVHDPDGNGVSLFSALD
jgi:catechol 2,3-dioxygenase-like lactoylglutathione lyase family enzyme